MSRELRRIGTLAVASMALMAIGCGGSSKSPIGPTSTGGSGAVITGTVRSGGASIAASTSAADQGVSVSVVGTNVRSGLDAGDDRAELGLDGLEVVHDGEGRARADLAAGGLHQLGGLPKLLQRALALRLLVRAVCLHRLLSSPDG